MWPIDNIRNWINRLRAGKNQRLGDATMSWYIVTVSRYLPFPSCIKEVREGPFESEKNANQRLDKIVSEKLIDEAIIGAKEKDIRECYAVVGHCFLSKKDVFKEADRLISELGELSDAEWVYIFRHMYGKVKNYHPAIFHTIKEDVKQAEKTSKKNRKKLRKANAAV